MGRTPPHPVFGQKKDHRPEYLAWQNMLARCRRSSHPDYHSYGGRGITVCDRWRESFWNFLQDMGHRPAPGLSIDRKNNDGNYEPGNCRWATDEQQKANVRPRPRTFPDQRRLSWGGREQTLAEWSAETGLPARLIYGRIQQGWEAGRALSAPPDPSGRRRLDAEPPYLMHKASGQAYCTFGGKCHYLGKHGSPVSKRRYRAALAMWRKELADGRRDRA